MRGHQYTKKEDNYIKRNYLKISIRQIAKNLNLTPAQVQRRMKTLKIALPKEIALQRRAENQFKKNQIPWNKGIYMRVSPQTEFKKGNIPQSTKYDGALSLRFNYDRQMFYLYIRIKKAKWLEYHRYLWKKHHGKIPKGYNVRFKDGNPLNCTIDNLMLCSKAENLKLNTKTVRELGDNYILSLLKLRDVYNKDEKLKSQINELIKIKREQLKLRRYINEVRNKT